MNKAIFFKSTNLAFQHELDTPYRVHVKKANIVFSKLIKFLKMKALFVLQCMVQWLRAWPMQHEVMGSSPTVS